VCAQIASGVRLRFADDFTRRSPVDELPAGAAAFGPEVDDAIRLRDELEIVLDDDDGVAPIDERLETAHELFDVGEVKPRRGLVEQVQRAAPR